MKNSVSSVQLKDNRWGSVGCFKIISIPHVSILDKNKALSTILEERLKNTEQLLNELYSFYSEEMSEVSFELLWRTSKVENQPYAAYIDIYFIVHSINSSRLSAERTIKELLNIISLRLNGEKYVFLEMSGENLLKELHNIDQNVYSITKKESVIDLSNNLLRYCLGFDRLAIQPISLQDLVTCLINYPDSAVSFQLIPYAFTQKECEFISKTAFNLGNLANGVNDPTLGYLRFPNAQTFSNTYSYYLNKSKTPLFLFNILVFGNDTVAKIIGNSLSSILTRNIDNQIGMQCVPLHAEAIDLLQNFYPLPWATNYYLLNYNRDETVWTIFDRYFNKLPFVLTSEEASTVFQLPIGSEHITAGLNITESERTDKNYKKKIINAGDISVGQLKSSSTNNQIGFDLNDLTKHMLIVGSPGSGKTNFSLSLLFSVWTKYHIPFLVIEPAKNEYRSLIQLIPDVQVFTPNKDNLSPLMLNPFIPPKNVPLSSYKSTLKTAFEAAIPMETPLDLIFEESINECYSRFKWLDNYTSKDTGEVFNIQDFILCFKKYFDSIGYSGDAQNIGRAGIVRLRSLIGLFDQYSSIPVEDFLNKPTIIELSAIENSDQKALIIVLLLLSIMSYVNTNYMGDGNLKNLLLLEEAHVLLDPARESQTARTANNLVKRILAEMRSYGIGMIIADQSPRKVTEDIIALTDIKTIFRIVEKKDKELIANSINMNDHNEKRLTKLKPGEAFFFFQKLDDPEEVIIPNFRSQKHMPITISDNELKDQLTYWINKKEQLRPYPQCKIGKHCMHSCDYHRRILAREIAKRIYSKHFKQNSKDFNRLYETIMHIRRETYSELNGEEFTENLLYCVKVHLWRKIKYETDIPIRDIQIMNSLRK